jgi:hypothetical protein
MRLLHGRVSCLDKTVYFLEREGLIVECRTLSPAQVLTIEITLSDRSSLTAD